MGDTNETLALAPAAGAGIGRLIAQELLSRPEFIRDIADAFKNGLNAKTRIFNIVTKKWDEFPDARVQIHAAVAILSHFEGDPVKRVIHQHLGTDGENFDPVKAVRASPALAEAMQRVLRNAAHVPGTPREIKPVQPLENEPSAPETAERTGKRKRKSKSATPAQSANATVEEDGFQFSS